MRVISGQFRGRALRTLKGLSLRPTSDRLKETLFNIIAPKVQGARFLDGFAGSGAIGIEALSRGAEWVFFVETNPRAVKIISKNLEACGITENYELLKMNASSAVAYFRQTNLFFDIIFLDPPYASDLYEKTIGLMAQTGILHADGILIAEHQRKKPLPEQFGVLRRYRIVKQGDSCLSFYAAT